MRRLGSSWEALLTVVADKSAPLLYGGAALVALQRLLKMLMDWQQHRMNLRVHSPTVQAIPLRNRTNINYDGAVG